MYYVAETRALVRMGLFTLTKRKRLNVARGRQWWRLLSIVC